MRKSDDYEPEPWTADPINSLGQEEIVLTQVIGRVSIGQGDKSAVLVAGEMAIGYLMENANDNGDGEVDFEYGNTLFQVRLSTVTK